MNVHAKFGVSSSNRSRDMEGPKISKLAHVTPSRPVNGGRQWPDIWIPRPRFAYSLYNFHGSTSQRWRFRVVYRRASPLLRPF